MIDFFGKREIRALRREIGRRDRDIEKLKAELKWRSEEALRHDKFFVEELERRFKLQQEQAAEISRLSTMSAKSEEVRKAQASKLREQQLSKEQMDSRFKALLADYSELVRNFEATKKELDELYQTHEALLKEAAYKKEPTICDEEVKTA